MSDGNNPPAAECKCRLEEVLDATLIELLRLVPRNPQVRALVLKLAGKLPPPECETFEQVKDWIQTHCAPRQGAAPARPAARQQVAEGIRLTVRFSDTEYGRADYSVRRQAQEEFHLEPDDLIELVRAVVANGDGLDEIVQAAAQRIADDAWEVCDPGMDDTGDYDYSNHDVSDTEDCATTFDRGELRRAILAFLHERHPELAAEL